MKTFPNKALFSIFVFMFILAACQPSPDLSGKIQGLNSRVVSVYLLKPETLREVAGSYLAQVVDSTKTNAKGEFEFHSLPKTEEGMLLELVVQPSGKSPNFLETSHVNSSNFMPIFWRSGKTLQITAEFEQFQKTFSIENPSKTNKALLQLRNVNQSAYQKYLLGRQWQLEDGKQLLEKEHAMLQYQSELINFADSTEYLMTALVATRLVSPVDDYERVPEFMVSQCNKWKNTSPENAWLQELCEQSAPSKLPILIGEVFPNLELPMITKDTLSINELLGKNLTIIDVWASWCGPCRKENRKILGPLWERYHDQGLQMIAYGLESDESAWKAALEQDGADRWPQASDLQGDDATFLKQIRIQTIPANFILDHNCVILAKNVHGEALSEWVGAYMQKK